MNSATFPKDGGSAPKDRPGDPPTPHPTPAEPAAADVVWIAYEGIDGQWHFMEREEFMVFETAQLWGMMMEFFPWDEIPKGKRNRQLPNARKPRGKVRPFLVPVGEVPENWQRESAP